MARYVVSSVTGYAITASGATRKGKTIWSVLDSAFCYVPVMEYARATTFMGATSFDRRGELRARAIAARLNALDLLGPPPPPAICARNGR